MLYPVRANESRDLSGNIKFRSIKGGNISKFIINKKFRKVPQIQVQPCLTTLTVYALSASSISLVKSSLMIINIYVLWLICLKDHLLRRYLMLPTTIMVNLHVSILSSQCNFLVMIYLLFECFFIFKIHVISRWSSTGEIPASGLTDEFSSWSKAFLLLFRVKWYEYLFF